MWDAGRRQWRHRILQSVGLRRQRGELTGYSFQVRLLSCRALRERNQHSCVLLLRQLNILQCCADGIWYRDRSRLTWRLCSEAIEIRQGQREVVETRQGDATKIRQRKAIEIRQRIGGGRANNDQSGEGHRYRRHSVRSPR